MITINSRVFSESISDVGGITWPLIDRTNYSSASIRISSLFEAEKFSDRLPVSPEVGKFFDAYAKPVTYAQIGFPCQQRISPNDRALLILDVASFASKSV